MTVIWGNRLKWLEHHADILSDSLDISLWNRNIRTVYEHLTLVGFSNRLMHLKMVDLPDPEGPISVTTWPFSIFRLIPFNTSRLPKLLCTSRNSITSVHPPFQTAGNCRQYHDKYVINNRNDQVGFKEPEGQDRNLVRSP